LNINLLYGIRFYTVIFIDAKDDDEKFQVEKRIVYYTEDINGFTSASLGEIQQDQLNQSYNSIIFRGNKKIEVVELREKEQNIIHDNILDPLLEALNN
jgi:hypothetical protein